jgi:hypothetical protein
MLNNLGRSWLSLCAVTVSKISSCFGTGLCCGTLLFLQGLLNWWSWQKAYKWRVIILPFLLKSSQSVFLAKVDDKRAIKSQNVEFNSFWRLFIAVLGFSYLILWSYFLFSAVACNKCSFWVCTWSSAFIMVVKKSRLLIWGDFKQGISLCRDHWSAVLHNRFHPSSVVSNSCLKILNITFFEMVSKCGEAQDLCLLLHNMCWSCRAAQNHQKEDSFRWYFTLSELSPDEHFTGKDIV